MREDRDRLTQTIVAYMKGEIRTREFEEVLDDLKGMDEPWERTSDEAVFQLAHELWFLYDDYVDHPVSVPEETWRYLERVLAFLQTDLELAPVRPRVVRHSVWLARVLVACVVLCAVAWPVFHTPVPLIVAWATSVVVLLVRPPHPSRSARAELERLEEYAPFWSEEEWLRHEALIERFDLPTYDPVQHARPCHDAVEERQAQSTFVIAAILFGPLLMLPNAAPLREGVLMVPRESRRAVGMPEEGGR